MDSKANVNARAKDGSSPLHLATARDRKAVAELLLAKGAEVEAQTQAGETPLCIAVRAGSKNDVSTTTDATTT